MPENKDMTIASLQNQLTILQNQLTTVQSENDALRGQVQQLRYVQFVNERNRIINSFSTCATQAASFNRH